MMQHKFLRGAALFASTEEHVKAIACSLSSNLTDLWLVPSVLWDRDTLERFKRHLGGEHG